MNLIQGAIAIAVVLGLLLPSNCQIDTNSGDIPVFRCPIDSTRELVEVNWYWNDRDVPSGCHIVDSKSNAESVLDCSKMALDNKGVYSCTAVYNDGGIFENDASIVLYNGHESIFQRDTCVCFGNANGCSDTNVNITYESVKVFSESSSPILLEMTSDGKTIMTNSEEYKHQNLRTISQMTLNGGIYLALSEEIVNKKLQLYGGHLTYQLSLHSANAYHSYPIALMHGNNKVLIYFQSGNSNSAYRRVLFTKHNWRILKEDNSFEQNANERDVLDVLTNLEGIYLIQHPPFAEKNSIAQLGLAECVGGDSGLPLRPSSIAMCNCPTGYAGAFCQICADNFHGNPVQNISCTSNSDIGQTNYTETYKYLPQSDPNTPVEEKNNYDNRDDKDNHGQSFGNDGSNHSGGSNPKYDDSNTEETDHHRGHKQNGFNNGRHHSRNKNKHHRQDTGSVKEAPAGNEMTTEGNITTTSTTSTPESTPGSSPNPAQFLYRSFDCLVLYIFSLCCSMWWYTFI